MLSYQWTFLMEAAAALVASQGTTTWHKVPSSPTSRHHPMKFFGKFRGWQGIAAV